MPPTTSVAAAAARTVRPLTSRLKNVPPNNVWSEFTPLAAQHKAVNLGQGFPDFHLEPFVQQAASGAITHANPLMNQYCRSMGNKHLVDSLSATFSPLFGRTLDADKEIVVCTGATGALFNTLHTILSPGDEAIIIEPFFDVYPGDTVMAGATPVYVPLHPSGTTANEWHLDEAELRGAITEKTKLILFNTPQNVPGKVWSRKELELIASVAKEHNLYVISDEVYERMLYDGCEHVRMATLPDMFERTVTVGSAGKTFSATGWKVGWVIGPANVLAGMAQYQAHLTFCVATPLQEAVAQALDAARTSNYYDELNQMYVRKREKLMNVVSEAGLPIVRPQGSYFFLADISSLDASVFTDKDSDVPKDWQFCRWLTTTIGVTAIPVTAFYSPEHKHLGENFIRFAFCKEDTAYDAAAERLKKLRDFFPTK